MRQKSVYETRVDAVWGYDHLPQSRTLDQHISKLRKTIELDPVNPILIRTVHGIGYRYQGGECNHPT